MYSLEFILIICSIIMVFFVIKFLFNKSPQTNDSPAQKGATFFKSLFWGVGTFLIVSLGVYSYFCMGNIYAAETYCGPAETAIAGFFAIIAALLVFTFKLLRKK